ncbi:MAG: molybdopterin-binding protein [Rickettsiales bacterium]
MQTTKSCLIVIGNEILSGRTQDENIRFIASSLGEIGISLAEVRVIPDVTATIVTTVNQCRSAFDYVFTTGGIGPTHDDITSDSIAQAFNVPIIRNPEAEAILEKHYGRDKLNAARLKMAEIPKGARLIHNPVSAAPGFVMENVYVMAGVPSIMQAMFDNIKGELKGGAKILSRTITIYTTEGNIAEGLTQIQNHFPDVEIGSYPFARNQRLGTSLVCRSSDKNRLETCYDTLKAFLTEFNTEIAEE